MGVYAATAVSSKMHSLYEASEHITESVGALYTISRHGCWMGGNVLFLGTEANHSELILEATGPKFLCPSVHSVSAC